MTLTSSSSLRRALLAALLSLPFIGLSGAAVEIAPRPIRVLFLGHEGKGHNSGKYLPYLMERFGREAIYFDYYTTPDCLNSETLSPYDTVMLYANHKNISQAQMGALSEFVESGHGFVPVQLGGKFKPNGGGEFKASILEPGHPIMEGVNEYETWDEASVHDQLNEEERKLLMERVEGDRREPWAWVRKQGKGRVFYTASGHDERTWKNPDFQLKLRNAILWSIGDETRKEWEAFLASREKEVREKNENVANYERRPEPITFQHPFSVKGSMERTQVPADMRLELFASEPDIRKPISFTFDERGRCWVAETSDYPHGVKPDGVGSDSIRICEDTDGDGKADKFTVFAEGLNIPTGLVFANGGVIVSQPPRFLFLKDTDGDDKADVREEIMTGWGIGDTHAQANNLHYGLDNWLYGCVGYSGFRGEVAGKKTSFAQGTYRFKADGSQLEFLHQFSNNSWAQSHNQWGDQFGGTANGAPIFYGGIPKAAFPEGMRGMTAKKINLVNQAHAITPNYRQVDWMGAYTAAAGSAFIYSDNLPPRMQGMALVTEPTMKLIALMDVREDGAGYVAHDGFNLVASTDEWMSPVFAEVGPDGAVWFADFQNFIIQHNPIPSVGHGGYQAKPGVGGAHENTLRDHERGRIYRVVWNEAKKPAITSLKGASDAELVRALASDNPLWRLKAQQMLVEGGRKGTVTSLREGIVENSKSSNIGSIHALWVLHGLGELDQETHRSALLAGDRGLRRNAVRALGIDKASQSLLFGSGTLSDPDPVTRLAAMIKLSEFPTSAEISTLVGGMGSDPELIKDEWLAEAARILSQKHNPFKEGANVLANSGFEEATGTAPAAWKEKNYGTAPGNADHSWEISSDVKHAGKQALKLEGKGGHIAKAMVLEAELKPNTYYRLKGWLRAEELRGRVSIVDRARGVETSPVSDTTDWQEVDLLFNSGETPRAEIHLVYDGGSGKGWFDDVRLIEMVPIDAAEDQAGPGDAARGEAIFSKHPVAACVNCHMLGGKGSAVGPALDGVGSRQDEAYLLESLINPNAKMAKGFESLPISSMPPMELILKPQELADVLAFLKGLKE